MPEANASLGERIVKLEVMAEHADDDRQEMKDAIKSIQGDVAAIKTLVEQVRGGVKVAWIAYGLIGMVAAGIGWLVSKFPWGAMPR